MKLREYAAMQTKATGRSTEAAAGTRARDKPQQPLPDRYKRIYRAVYDFHTRHAPAPQTLEEMTAVAEDIGRTANAGGNDPFLTALLMAVAAELEREYKATAAPTDTPCGNF